MILSETLDDLVMRNGLIYKKFSEVPYTGKVNGTSQGAYENGKPEGTWISYYNNGQIASKGTYKNGKLEGPHVIYYSNGKLSEKGTYKNGKKEGPSVGFHLDGTAWDIFTGTFKNGEKVK